ncbi:MAG: NTPase [Ignisphaera sp.]
MIRLAITGDPGVGKTTLLLKLVKYIASVGVSVYGFYCPEVREEGRRIGFKIVDIAKNSEGWLALVPEKAIEMGYNISVLKKIGRYVLIHDEAERIGKEALALYDTSAVLVIDEIGPMELSIGGLREAIIKAIKLSSNLMVTIHRNMRDKEIWDLLHSKGVEIVVLTKMNRDKMFDTIIDRIRDKISKIT